VTWVISPSEALVIACVVGGLGYFGVLAFTHRGAIARSREFEYRGRGCRAFLSDRGWNVVRTGAITWTRPLAVRPLAEYPDLVVADFAWGMSYGAVSAAFVARLQGEERIAIEMADLPAPLPPLVVCPVVFDHTLTELASGHAFLSESTDFNATWVVRAQDSRYASAILTPRFMERLLADDASDMWLIIDGGALMTITQDADIPDDRIAAHLAALPELVALIPPAVYADFATAAPGNSWRWATKWPGYSWLITPAPQDSS